MQSLALWCLVGMGAAPAEGAAQIVYEEYRPLDGYLRIGPEPERAIRLTEKGFTLLLPDGAEEPSAVVVFFDPRRFDGWSAPDTGTFDYEALRRNVGVLHLTTGNPLDFFFDQEELRDVASRLEALLERYNLRGVPVCFAGLSLGGTRALRLTVFLERQKSEYWIRPTAVAVVDAPLDFVRMWESEGRSLAKDYHPNATDEARWVRYLLETNLGGPPHERYRRYVEYSPYVYEADGGGNASFLVNTALRAYHEPDIDWWIANRRKSYYDMNSLDLAALITELQLRGIEAAELVTTHRAREGWSEGTSPHSWSIVDNAELVDWFLAQSR